MKVEIKNLKKTANRILKAVDEKEKIILYGDADPDGIASVIILKEALEILEANLSKIYFPDRETEGYGINEEALKFLEPEAPALFLALDCGIGNFKEVKIAKKMGFEVVIIDHHEVLSKLPEASIIVDPKQKDDKYPFKHLSTAGIVYKLVKILLFQEHESFEQEKFLELVAISTLADQMPLLEENKDFVKKGILALNQTKRPGLKVLMELTDFKTALAKDEVSGWEIEEVRKKILPPLNLWGAENHQSQVYSLLTENSPKKAEDLAKILLKKSKERKEKIKKIFEEVESRITQSDEPFVFEGNPFWPLILAGPVASKICQKHKKPTFIFKKDLAESMGSVRIPSGFNGVDALISCSHLLKTYGGHALAAGFRLKNENLEKFKKCLIKYFTESSKTKNN